ncbi:MAG: hypothetical protein ABW157_19895 [Candidatus Thiodiazotropha sp. LLP2]
MSSYQLKEQCYLLPSPAGAFHVTANQHHDPMCLLLRNLLKETSSPMVDSQSIEHWTGLQGEDALEILFRAQNLGWVETFESEQSVLPGSLEEILPDLLTPISDCGKILLADSHGFYITTIGFSHEASVELSALSADVASLDSRHRSLTHNNLGMTSSAWSLVDAAGNSQLGFWPLYIGNYRFVIALQGAPQFNQPAFTSLVWALSARYANPLDHSS